MAGFAVGYANRILDSLGTVWIRLHVGPPGPDGSRNVAVESTHQPCLFDLAGDGAVTSATRLVWVDVPSDEQWSHFTAWDGTGMFLFPGTVTADAVIAGDTYTVEPGALTAHLTVAR